MSFFFLWAIGGSLSSEVVTDNELFIRWLEIVAFLPVLSFQTPPWASGVDKVTNFHSDIKIVLSAAHCVLDNACNSIALSTQHKGVLYRCEVCLHITTFQMKFNLFSKINKA